jgi:hypothetical protein
MTLRHANANRDNTIFNHKTPSYLCIIVTPKMSSETQDNTNTISDSKVLSPYFMALSVVAPTLLLVYHDGYRQLLAINPTM